MTQTTLDFTTPVKPPEFDGVCYDSKRDRKRLTGQIERVYEAMRGGEWRTLNQIAEITGDPHSSVSAQLRNLRKERFGGHTVEREHIKDGLYKYRINHG